MTSKHRSTRNHERDQARIAQAAARLMHESGSRDMRHARFKAARQLGIDDSLPLPDEAQITRALDDHLRLFAPASHTDALLQKRAAAAQALAFFHAFSPRLTGPVLLGHADGWSSVQLHLHSDPPEAVQMFLEDQRIPATQASARIRLQRGAASSLPCWHMDADGISFELLVLPMSALRQTPLQELDDAPMPRASLAQLQLRIAAELTRE